MEGNDKKDEFKQERMFGRVAKIPVSDTFDELVEVDFADYGGYATFLHIQDTFSRFPFVIFLEQRNGRTNGGNGNRKCDFRSDCYSWDT